MNPAIPKARHVIDCAGAAACAALVALFCLVGLRPILHQRLVAQAAEKTLLHQRERLAAARSSLQGAKADLDAARAYIAADPLRLEPVAHINRRLAHINSIAAAHGLELRDVQPGRMMQSAHYQTVPLRITGIGSYQGCAEFLRDLHQTLRDTSVIGFGLSASPEDPRTPKLFVFELRWHAAAPDLAVTE